MMRLVLKATPPVRLDMSALLPESLAGMNEAAVADLPLALGNCRERVGDWFRVEAGTGGTLQIEGALERLDRIGAGMSQGSIHIRGSAGAYLGMGMSGGEIAVEGSVGFGAATALKGGILRIAGDAGDGLGGAEAGDAGGMRGGTVIVAGKVGAAAGQGLWRGLIAIGGDAGPGCGARMVAGTIIIGGALGPHAGVAMHRGSIVALGGLARLAPTFNDCGVFEFGWLRLLQRHVDGLGLGGMAARLRSFRRFVGDAAIGGTGEILLAT